MKLSRIFSQVFSWGVLFALVCGFLAALPGGAEAHQALGRDPFDLPLLELVGFAGLVVNQSTISAITKNLLATFNKALETAPSQWDQIAMRVGSTGAQNDYSWLDRFPKMREWIGERTIKNLKAYTYVIVNKLFEVTIGVKRTDIEDDNLGIYAPIVSEAGYSAAQLPDELIFDLVNSSFDATKGLAYDGQYFFDTDHPVGAGVVSNKGSTALSAATQAAAIASLGAARTAMMAFKDEEGRPLNIVPNILLVPPALEAVALVLANNEKLEDQKPNPYKGMFRVIVSTRLTSATAWILLDTTKAIKPFVWQERRAPEFVSQTEPTSDTVFLREEYLYGASARGNAGFGLWQLAYGTP